MGGKVTARLDQDWTKIGARSRQGHPKITASLHQGRLRELADARKRYTLARQCFRLCMSLDVRGLTNRVGVFPEEPGLVVWARHLRTMGTIVQLCRGTEVLFRAARRTGQK